MYDIYGVDHEIRLVVSDHEATVLNSWLHGHQVRLGRVITYQVTGVIRSSLVIGSSGQVMLGQVIS